MARENERTFTLGSKTYPVRLTIGVLSRAESKTDRNYLEPRIWDGGLKPADVLALAWAIVSDSENPTHDPAKDEGIYERLARQITFGQDLYDIRSALYGAAVDAVAVIDTKTDVPKESASEAAGPELASTSDSLDLSTSR